MRRASITGVPSLRRTTAGKGGANSAGVLRCALADVERRGQAASRWKKKVLFPAGDRAYDGKRESERETERERERAR
jgi:hypothetical protein